MNGQVPHFIIFTTEYSGGQRGGLSTYSSMLMRYLQQRSDRFASINVVVPNKGRTDQIEVGTGELGETIVEVPHPTHLYGGDRRYYNYLPELSKATQHLPLEEDCVFLANDLTCGYTADQLSQQAPGHHHLIYVTHLLKSQIVMNGYDAGPLDQFIDTALGDLENTAVASSLTRVFLELSMLKKFDSVLFISEYMREYVQTVLEVDPSHSAVIEHCIDVPDVTKTTYRDTVRDVIFAGRAEPQKGLQDLLEHFDVLIEHLPEATFHFYTKGAMSSLTEWRTRRFGDRVQVHGYIEREVLMHRITEMDLMLVPSIFEPFGFAALEAMARGTPLLASNIGGLGELTSWLPEEMRFQPRIGENPLYNNPESVGYVLDRSDIERVVRFAANNPDVLKSSAQTGQEVARSRYNPERYREDMDAFLASIYRRNDWTLHNNGAVVEGQY